MHALDFEIEVVKVDEFVQKVFVVVGIETDSADLFAAQLSRFLDLALVALGASFAARIGHAYSPHANVLGLDFVAARILLFVVLKVNKHREELVVELDKEPTIRRPECML